MDEEEKEDIDIFTDESLESLTTVIGIRCKEGIVLATDSQASIARGVDMKRHGVKKIIPIKKISDGYSPLYALAGAGNAYHVKALAEELIFEIGDRTSNYIDLKEKVMEILNKTYKKYNADRLKSLGLTEKETEKKYFNATSLLGAKLFGNHFGLFLLNSDPWVEPIIDYETIGSGAPFANLMLQQLNRGLERIGISFYDLSLMFCLLYATYIINEVKTVDVKSGGSTKIGLIDAYGYREIPDRLLTERYNAFLDTLTSFYGKMLTDPRIPKDAIRGIFPPHQ